MVKVDATKYHLPTLYKIKNCLPYQYYEILKSYFQKRKTLVKFKGEQTKVFLINYGFPQGSVIGPISTANMTTNPHGYNCRCY